MAKFTAREYGQFIYFPYQRRNREDFAASPLSGRLLAVFKITRLSKRPQRPSRLHDDRSWGQYGIELSLCLRSFKDAYKRF
jgi:hypothetical protein